MIVNGEIEDTPIFLKEARNYHNEFVTKIEPKLRAKEPEVQDYTELVFESDLQFIDE